jgi:hypothetical protein
LFHITVLISTEGTVIVCWHIIYILAPHKVRNLWILLGNKDFVGNVNFKILVIEALHFSLVSNVTLLIKCLRYLQRKATDPCGDGIPLCRAFT